MKEQERQMSFVLSRVKKNAYYDSVRLMRVATNLQAKAGVLDAAIIVGTERNKEFLKDTNLLTDEIKNASSNDLCFVVEARSREIGEQALAEAESMLEGMGSSGILGGHKLAYSLESALEMLSANVALISIPGMYVKREAIKCLERGLHLLIFSDNVSKADELAIKKRATDLNLLVMGPDCGTAIINNIALGFANAVHPGPIGLVGASGTGLQEVTCLIDHLGLGVSHAIGTGSNDVSQEIGAITMLRGIRMLAYDLRTKVIVIISKPPSPQVAGKVIETLQACGKPAVVNFLGEPRREGDRRIHFVDTMEEAALTALEVAGCTASAFLDVPSSWAALRSAITKLAREQKFVRGIFGGGTFTVESGLILSQQLERIYTNTMIGERLVDPLRSIGHACVDLGDDLFTAGRPHPMLEPAVRSRRIVAEMQDPETAVILLDMVLGYGAHPDPARELLLALNEGRSADRYVPVVASVCGTDRDPQNRSQQVAVLEGAGVFVFPSNAAATRAAAFIASRGKVRMKG
jgi:FdrA protein